MEFPRVLVASPTYNVMEYCEDEFINSIKSLDYPNYNLLIIDNSKDEAYFHHLREKFPEINILRDNTNEEKNMLRLISSRNKIIDYALENNYDYVLMLDSDVLPPKNTINELLACKKDLVSGLYYNYFLVDGKMKYLPVAWTSLTEKEFEEIKQKVQLPKFIKSHLDLRAHLTEEEANSGELIEVVIPSAGLLLISREVLTKIKYGLLDTSEQGNVQTADDIHFILKAREAGFIPHCLTQVKAEHLIKGKFKKDGNTYKHPIFE